MSVTVEGEQEQRADGDRAPAPLPVAPPIELPADSLGYRLKRRVLGQPLHSDELEEVIERDVSVLPHVNVTTVPFHFDTRPPNVSTSPSKTVRGDFAATQTNGTRNGNSERSHQSGRDGVTPIAQVEFRQRVRVEGRVRSLRVQPMAVAPSVECVIADETGALSAVFVGRRTIPGLDVGSRLRVEGMAGESKGRLAILNPTYELLPGGPSGRG